MNNSFKIIVPFYNASEFIEGCVNSIMTQKYDNFKVIFIDDASTDDSWDKLPHGDERVICIKNRVNLTALENIHNATMDHCEPDDIVVLVDGDDKLQSKKVLSYINDFYNENDCWIMYGQSTWTNSDKNPNGTRGVASAYSPEEFNRLRETGFRVSHIRTYIAGLYQNIQDQDPGFSCMKDNDGKFYRCTYDVAIMYPIMEMAGFDKVKYNDKSLYIYNRENPISDDRVRQKMQWDIHAEILQKKAFNKIDKINE